ncbi:Flp pilus assembly protein CpaB [Phenylobacterium sp.]|uniref:Flp pilus assembly protein CpaB n=1 Tax=Phenylobacterium sp. TaxID=1871053 RepID=UPI0025E40590|nr:Flp pilus assembly protein CpaB [Phenylobacterium sp.]
MRVVTIVSLAASAVLGLGALFVAKIALPNAAAAKSPIRPEAVGQPVVVASRPLKYGEKLDAGMLKIIKVPETAVPEGAYTTVEQALAADHGGAPVVLTPIAGKEAVLPTKLSGPGSRPIVSAEVAEGMRAYTLKVNDASGVGGHALPGDHVDVVLMRDLTPRGDQRNYISYVVVQNARVLGIDLNADPTSNKPATPNTATIEVSVEDSQKLAIASTLGELSLALRRNGQADIAKAPPMRTSDFLGGAPAVRTSGPARSGPARPFSAILIVEGEANKRPRVSKAPAPPPAAAPVPQLPTATS